MRTPFKKLLRNNLIRAAATAAVFTLAMGLQWGDGSNVQAQISGQSTGICSDYEGNNFPCSDGGGGYSGGGGYGGGGYGGCATTGQREEQRLAAIHQENARSLIFGADQSYDDGDYASAATLFQIAMDEDPNNDYARKSLGSALNELGRSAWDRYENMSAYLYFSRAVDVKPESDVIRDNLQDTLDEGVYQTCSECGEAIINDVAYGLDSSALLTNYVHQATANYKNCTRKLSCGGSEGQDFFDLMRDTCLRNFGANQDGFYGCVSQVLSDFGL